MRFIFVLILIFSIFSIQGLASEITDINITNICNNKLCATIDITTNSTDKNYMSYIWTSEKDSAVYDDKVNKKLLDYNTNSTDFCITIPLSNSSLYLYIKTYHNGSYYNDKLTYTNKQLNCEDFKDPDEIKQQLFRKVLRYPVISIPYDDNGNIFDDVKEINEDKIFEITFGQIIYFFGIILLIIYIVIVISEKF